MYDRTGINIFMIRGATGIYHRLSAQSAGTNNRNFTNLQQSYRQKYSIPQKFRKQFKARTFRFYPAQALFSVVCFLSVFQFFNRIIHRNKVTRRWCMEVFVLVRSCAPQIRRKIYFPSFVFSSFFSFSTA